MKARGWEGEQCKQPWLSYFLPWEMDFKAALSGRPPPHSISPASWLPADSSCWETLVRVGTHWGGGWWDQHPSLCSHHLPQEPRLLGGFPEAGLTWRGREEAKTRGLASGASLGMGSRLLLEPGCGTSSAQAPRGGPGLGAGDWVLGQALSMLPQPLPSFSGCIFTSNKHHPACLVGLGADSMR